MVIPLGDTQRTTIVPVVTYALIAINVLIYGLQLSRPEAFTIGLAATPFEIVYQEDLDGPTPILRPGSPPVVVGAFPQAPTLVPIWLTLLTSLFLHETPLHLAGNMLYLWIFGDNVEEVLGHLRYLVVFLLCGMIGTLCQVAGNPDSVLPTLGASGAIAGVMAMYLVWFPRHRVRVFVIRIIEVPAIAVLGLWILVQVGRSIGTLGQIGVAGGVAFLAHLGGAAVGFAVAFAYRDRARRMEQGLFGAEE